MKSLIAKSLRDSKSKDIYVELLENSTLKIEKPHLFVGEVLERFNDTFPNADRSIHGRIFELAIGEVLAQNGIGPLYYQAEIAHVPLAKFDWLLYSREMPVSLSCKTKARDRWKQAAYEGMALKRVYPQAINYMITIEPISAISDKLRDAPQTIDHFIVATDPDFDDVLTVIKQMRFSKAEAISPITGGNFIEI